MGIDLSSRILKYRKKVNERVNRGDDRLCSVQTAEESENEMKICKNERKWDDKLNNRKV